jgi:hypothetical protein
VGAVRAQIIETFWTVEWRHRRRRSKWRLVATRAMYEKRKDAVDHAQMYLNDGFHARIVWYRRVSGHEITIERP